MIPARWAPPLLLQRRLPPATGKPAFFRTLQARLPTPSRYLQPPEARPIRLRSPSTQPHPALLRPPGHRADPGPAMQSP